MTQPPFDPETIYVVNTKDGPKQISGRDLQRQMNRQQPEVTLGYAPGLMEAVSQHSALYGLDVYERRFLNAMEVVRLAVEAHPEWQQQYGIDPTWYRLSKDAAETAFQANLPMAEAVGYSSRNPLNSLRTLLRGLRDEPDFRMNPNPKHKEAVGDLALRQAEAVAQTLVEAQSRHPGSFPDLYDALRNSLHTEVFQNVTDIRGASITRGDYVNGNAEWLGNIMNLPDSYIMFCEMLTGLENKLSTTASKVHHGSLTQATQIEQQSCMSVLPSR